MSLQSSWAMAMSYCQHETGQAAQHFAHHGHQHQQTSPDGEDGAASSTPFQPHADCGACHLNCPAVASPSCVPGVVRSAFVVADPPQTYLSVFPEGFERPNWLPA